MHENGMNITMQSSIALYSTSMDMDNLTTESKAAEAEKKWLKRHLSRVQAAVGFHGNDNLKEVDMDIRAKLKDILDNEELLWKQKSKSTWLSVSEGDPNIKYFSLSNCSPHKKNRIQALRISNGDWCYDEDTLIRETFF
ncbi:hypothetical protein F3Y22_tig00110384pilonHSYRG00851 [Hibiscus syriacus]|uniref:Uncharacterized protein n=1 Tax=Hibiscus syriacus TaxID=106335 RepID=A0A6A3ARV6_HIBSY|nr:hypothetical protein F3Y22_tig00110384pilonHSYRG00851 [Hibiscus syriacus]